MLFTTVCSACGSEYQVPEQAIGRTVNCRKCQKAFVVQGKAPASEPEKTKKSSAVTRQAVTAKRSQDSGESPRRKSADRDKPSKPAPKSSALPWILGGIACFLGLSFLATAGGAAWYFLGSSKNTTDAVVETKAPLTPTQTTPEEPKVEPAKRKEETPPKVDPSKKPAEPRAPRGQLSAQALKHLKGATVFVKVSAGRLSCTGSGFLCKIDGDTGYIITNHHVVNPEAEMLQPVRIRRGRTTGYTMRVVKVKVKNAQVSAVFHSGTKSEQVIKCEVLATDEDRDLAVLRVKGLKDWPKPIALSEKADIVETMQVYILGFPFGEALAMKKGNPTPTINKGSVSSLRENEFGQMKAVQIDGAINPGNSGGPVVDEDGRLLGISVATIRGSGIGLAIAPDELTRMFQGRVGGIALKTKKIAPVAEYDVNLQLIDPEGKIKSAWLLYQAAAVQPPKLKPDADGAFAPLDGAQRVDLKVGEQLATGSFTLDRKGLADRFVVFQTGYVNGSGKTIYTQLLSKPIAAEPGVTSPVVTDKPPDKPVGKPGGDEPVEEEKDDKATVESELAKLRGKWKMVSMAGENGREDPNADRKGLLIDGTDYYFLFDGKKGGDAKIKLDPSTTPKSINVVSGRGTQLGIYRFTKGGGLQICMNQAQGKGSDKRPMTFTTRTVIGAGSILYTLKKEVEKEVEKPVVTGDKPTVESELAKLNGKWKMVGFSLDGRDIPDFDRKGVLIDGTDYWFLNEGSKSNDSKIKIDPTTTPKSINLISGRGTQQGIYQFTKDGELQICMNQAQGKGSDKRPTKFTTTAVVGAGSILYALKKEGEKEEKTEVKGDKPTVKSELAKLAGKWKMVGFSLDGRDIPDFDRKGVLIDGTDYWFLNEGSKSNDSKIKIDPTTTPKSINLISGRGTQLGIYQFTKDGELQICMNQAQGKGSDKRPTKFTTNAVVGAGSILYALKNDKESPPVGVADEKAKADLEKAERAAAPALSEAKKLYADEATRKKGEKALEDVVKKHPSTKAAKEANELLAATAIQEAKKLLAGKDTVEKGKTALRSIARQFPGSTAAEEASNLLRAEKAKEAALVEANQIAASSLRIAKKQIDDNQFSKAKDRFGPAKKRLQRIIDKYPETKSAEEARKLLEGLK